MGRLIDADNITYESIDSSDTVREEIKSGCGILAVRKEDIDAMPTIEELKTGKWEKISPANIYECSVCGQNVMTADIDAYRFCHGCGADMRGERNDNN